MFPENKLLQIYSLAVKFQIFAIYFANFRRQICYSGHFYAWYSCTPLIYFILMFPFDGILRKFTMEKALKIISGELAEFEEHFRQAVKSKVPLLDRIMHYIVKRKGKQLRPMFVFLSASVCGGKWSYEGICAPALTAWVWLTQRASVCVLLGSG